MSNAEMYGAAVLSVTQGFGAFMAFLPKISDVRKALPTDPDIVADVRVGELAGAIITLGVGGIVSSLTGSSIPMVTAAFMAVVIIALYESVLHANPNGATSHA